MQPGMNGLICLMQHLKDLGFSVFIDAQTAHFREHHDYAVRLSSSEPGGLTVDFLEEFFGRKEYKSLRVSIIYQLQPNGSGLPMPIFSLPSSTSDQSLRPLYYKFWEVVREALPHGRQVDPWRPTVPPTRYTKVGEEEGEASEEMQSVGKKMEALVIGWEGAIANEYGDLEGGATGGATKRTLSACEEEEEQQYGVDEDAGGLESFDSGDFDRLAVAVGLEPLDGDATPRGDEAQIPIIPI